MVRSHTNRRGLGLVYTIIILLALCGIASMAVDLGRVTLAKTQLRAASDAAALAAGQYVLSDLNAARAAAIATAKLNKADGSPVILDPSDIQFVKWDPSTRTYQLASSTVQPNAVRIAAHRTAARGNPIDLPFAKMVGANTCDVQATAIAMATPSRYAAVGLDFITMGGNATNAYRSNNLVGPPAGNFTSNGSIASNGDITLSGSSMVNGDAFPGVGHVVIGANHVTGSTNPLTRPLVYPPADPGNGATVNNNASVPSTAMTASSFNIGNQKSVTLSTGTYYFKNLSMGAGSTLNLSGPVTIYLTGNLSLGGHALTNGYLPKNLRIVMLGAGTTASLSGGTDLFADIYAPLTAIIISGNGDIYGSIVAKSLAMTGEAGIHYDLSLTGGVQLVK